MDTNIKPKPEWHQRLEAEVFELQERMIKLNLFQAGPQFSTLHVADQMLLKEQYLLMGKLWGVLNSRLRRADGLVN